MATTNQLISELYLRTIKGEIPWDRDPYYRFFYEAENQIRFEIWKDRESGLVTLEIGTVKNVFEKTNSKLVPPTTATRLKATYECLIQPQLNKAMATLKGKKG